MGLFIIVLLLVIITVIFNKFKLFVYLLAMVDILLRIVAFIKMNVVTKELTSYLNKYMPESIPNLISTYSNGVFYDLLIWFYVIIFAIFEVYLIKMLIKRSF